MCRSSRETRSVLILAAGLLLGIGLFASPATGDVAPGPVPAAPEIGGTLPSPLPLFPPDNWWNLDVSSAPVDPGSAAFLATLGSSAMHPDFGGEESPGSVGIYGIPYVLVDSTQPKKVVNFYYPNESDGQGVPFYPIPDEAITQPHWIEGGPPGQEQPGGDRHMLIVDRQNKFLYELFDLHWDGAQWQAGSGAFFDMKTNNRRPEGWTSADAAGLAILPGLVRYDEVFEQAEEIRHAFRVTVRRTNGHVYPASHTAGNTAGALPMGARLRMKASKDISGYPAAVQKIFRAMKKHGLIVADNGSNLYVTGTFDTRWDNGVLNPAFHSMGAGDFEVVRLGYVGVDLALSVTDTPDPAPAGGTATHQIVVVNQQDIAATGVVVTDVLPAGTAFVSGSSGCAPAGQTVTCALGTLPPGAGVALSVSFTAAAPGTYTAAVSVAAAQPDPDPADNTAAPATTFVPMVSIADVSVTEGNAGSTSASFAVTLSAAHTAAVDVAYQCVNGTAVAGSDYTPCGGTLQIPAGQPGGTIVVSVLGDLLNEPNERFFVYLTGATQAVVQDGEGIGTILDDDGPFALTELTHGAGLVADLAAPGPDLYLVELPPYSSLEVLVDAASGDIGTGAGPDVDRVAASDYTTVVASAGPVGNGPARSLVLRNDTAFRLDAFVRVRSASCTTTCGTDDRYRIRVRETTGAVPRFNNAGAQVTVLVVQNTGASPVTGTAHFWSPAGTRLGGHPFAIGPRATLVLNTGAVPGLSGQSGTVSVVHDAPYGTLAGKTVALDASAGFSFDTPMVVRVR